MGRVITYVNKQGKLNCTIIGGDPRQSIVLSTNQGYENRGDLEAAILRAATTIRNSTFEKMTHKEYRNFLNGRVKRKRNRKREHTTKAPSVLSDLEILHDKK